MATKKTEGAPDSSVLPQSRLSKGIDPGVIQPSKPAECIDIRRSLDWLESAPQRVIEEAMRIIVKESGKSHWGFKFEPQEMPLHFPTARGLKDLTVEDVLQLWPEDEWGALLVPKGTDNFTEPCNVRTSMRKPQKTR